jgi:hypothetical protein
MNFNFEHPLQRPITTTNNNRNNNIGNIDFGHPYQNPSNISSIVDDAPTQSLRDLNFKKIAIDNNFMMKPLDSNPVFTKLDQ